jgi:hypothetical protein
VAGLPLGDDLGRQLAGNGVGGEDAGIDVKQFHGQSFEVKLRIAAMDQVCG